jgi:hypothetical protein
MIQRLSAPSCLLFAAAMSMVESAKAGVWITEPVLGLAADYSTNPALLYTDHTAETHGAVLIDAPTTYHSNDVSFSIQPSFRISNSSGYSSLASDYAHLTAVGELDSERNTLTVTGQLARDSSLYYDYGLNGSTGVRRDTTSVDAAWARQLTERLNFNWDIESSRVVYGESNSFTTLTDYHYTSAAPSVAWNASERTTLRITGGVGLYESNGGETKSVNSNLELGFKRQLTETYTLSATAGYSRESNKISQNVLAGYEILGDFLVPVFSFESFRSTNNGSVFSGNLTRAWRLFSWTATASRSLVPTGFAFLARQTSYQLSFDYPWTERWTFDGHVRRLTSVEPQVLGPTTDDSYWDLGLSAAWLITEKWTLTLRASRVNAKYTPPSVDVAATGFSVQFSRRFNRIAWH